MTTIPSINPYTMPHVEQLSDNVAGWRVNADRAMLLVHDMQHYFIAPFSSGESPGAELVDNIAALRESCDGARVPVSYTAQPGGMRPDQRGLLQDFWGPGMGTDADDRGIIDALAPSEGDRMYTKWRYSAFFGTTLLEDLRTAGRDQLVICGVYAHVGVLVSAIESFSHDIETFVVSDAVADFTATQHRAALDYAATRCAVVLPTAAIVASLEPSAAYGIPTSAR